MRQKILLVMLMVANCLLARPDEYYIQWNSISDEMPGNLLSWKVFRKHFDETGRAVTTPYTNCTAVLRRNGIAIATVNVVSANTSYRDLDVIAGSTNIYTVAAMGVESTDYKKVCALSYTMTTHPVSSMSFTEEGGTQTTTISGSQIAWSKASGYTYSTLNWSCRSSALGWLKASRSGDELRVKAERLTGGTARSAIVNITLNGYIIARVSVVQGDASACTDVTVTDETGRQIIVEGQWFDKYPVLADTYGSNETAAMADAANGLKVWECFVAGLDPTNANSRFTSTIEFENGFPIIRWEPNLNEDGNERIYTIYGKASLDDGDGWTTPTNSLHRFFKVGVEMP